MMESFLKRLPVAVHLVLLAGTPLMWKHQGLNLYQVMLPLMQPLNRVLTQPDHLVNPSQLELGHHTLGTGNHLMTKVKVLNVGLIGPGLK